MRRRYGIPDHDQRPFNVAYAAARLAQEDFRKRSLSRGLSSALSPKALSSISEVQSRAHVQGIYI